MLIPTLGIESEISGYFWKWPKEWLNPDLAETVMRATKEYKDTGVSCEYESGTDISGGPVMVSADTQVLYDGIGGSYTQKLIKLDNNRSKRSIVVALDAFQALKRLAQTYDKPDQVVNFVTSEIDIPDAKTGEDRERMLSSVRLFRPGVCNYINSMPASINEFFAEWARQPKLIDIGKIYCPTLNTIVTEIDLDEPIYYTDLSSLDVMLEGLSGLMDMNNMPKWPFNNALGDTSERTETNLSVPQEWCRNEREFSLELANKIGMSEDAKRQLSAAENPWLNAVRSGGYPPMMEFCVYDYRPDYELVQQKWEALAQPKKTLSPIVLSHMMLTFPYSVGFVGKSTGIQIDHVTEHHFHHFTLQIDLSKVEMKDPWPDYLYGTYTVTKDAIKGEYDAYGNDIEHNLKEYGTITNKFTQQIGHNGAGAMQRIQQGTVDIYTMMEEGFEIEDDGCLYFAWSDLHPGNSDITRSFRMSHGGSGTLEVQYNIDWDLIQKEGRLSGIDGGRWPAKAIGDSIESFQGKLLMTSEIEASNEETDAKTNCLAAIDTEVSKYDENGDTWAEKLKNLSAICVESDQKMQNQYWDFANDYHEQNEIDFKWPIALNERQDPPEIDYAQAFNNQISIVCAGSENLENCRLKVTQWGEDGQPLLWDVECYSRQVRNWIIILDEFNPISYETWSILYPEQIPPAVRGGDGSDEQCFKKTDATYQTEVNVVGEFLFT